MSRLIKKLDLFLALVDSNRLNAEELLSLFNSSFDPKDINKLIELQALTPPFPVEK